MEIKVEKKLDLKDKIVNIYNLNKKKNIYYYYSFYTYYNINNSCEI